MLIDLYKSVLWIVTSIKSDVFEISDISKNDKKTIVPGISRFVTIIFKYLKKGMSI